MVSAGRVCSAPMLLASCALCLPCKRLGPALSCPISDIIVVFGIETAYDVLGFKQTSRSVTQNRSERERYLLRVGARGCSDRSHLVPSHASGQPSATTAAAPALREPLKRLSTILTSPMPAAQCFGTWADQDGSLSRSMTRCSGRVRSRSYRMAHCRRLC